MYIRICGEGSCLLITFDFDSINLSFFFGCKRVFKVSYSLMKFKEFQMWKNGESMKNKQISYRSG